MSRKAMAASAGLLVFALCCQARADGALGTILKYGAAYEIGKSVGQHEAQGTGATSYNDDSDHYYELRLFNKEKWRLIWALIDTRHKARSQALSIYSQARSLCESRYHSSNSDGSFDPLGSELLTECYRDIDDALADRDKAAYKWRHSVVYWLRAKTGILPPVDPTGDAPAIASENPPKNDVDHEDDSSAQEDAFEKKVQTACPEIRKHFRLESRKLYNHTIQEVEKSYPGLSAMTDRYGLGVLDATECLDRPSAPAPSAQSPAGQVVARALQ